MARALRGVLALAVLLALASDAGAAAQVYKARHRPAAELVPLAEGALAGRGTAVVDERTNSLVLVAEPDVLAEVVAVLELQDRRIPTVVLRYEARRADELESAGVAVAWSVGGGSIRVGNATLPETGIAVRPEDRSADAESSLRGTLRVLSGEEGRIATGSARPLVLHGPRYDETVYIDAARGFAVRPRVLGDGRVHLDVEPFAERHTAGGAVAHTRAATQIVVAPGETVAIGGLGESGDAARRERLAGAGRTSARSELVLLVTVGVE